MEVANSRQFPPLFPELPELLEIADDNNQDIACFNGVSVWESEPDITVNSNLLPSETYNQQLREFWK